MKTPGAVLAELLGPLNSVTILDATYDLAAEVAIDQRADMEELLLDNVERVAKWQRIEAACAREAARYKDGLEEARARWTIAYWNGLEERERKEMSERLHDETELDRDAQDAASGDNTFRIRRRQRAADRVTMGPAAGRWRRNFSDDLLRAHVNQEPEIVTLKKQLRRANAHLHLATCVLHAVEHRSRAISHLCAIHRDKHNSRS